jgi:hypothetical protein
MKLNYTYEDYKTLLSKTHPSVEDKETLEEAFVIPKSEYYLIKALAEEALEAREIPRPLRGTRASAAPCTQFITDSLLSPSA